MRESRGTRSGKVLLQVAVVACLVAWGGGVLRADEADRSSIASPDLPEAPSELTQGVSAPSLESTSTGSRPGALEAVPGGQNFENDLPAREHVLGHSAGTVPNADFWPRVHGLADGQLAVLAREDFVLKSYYSTDGGATFSQENVVADQLLVRSAHEAFLADGTIYAALRIADPLGDMGLQVIRSDDMGQTWSAPADVVRHGDDAHGVTFPRIAANASGTVAVVYYRWWGYDPYASVSVDAGSTWSTPVRLDPGISEGSANAAEIDVAVDESGTVHVVFCQNRGGGFEPLYTRSVDGGASFDAEISLDSSLPSGERQASRRPDLAIAEDGSLLIALWDAFDGTSSDRLYVLRSADGGSSFNLSLSRTLPHTGSSSAPQFSTRAGSPTLLLALLDSQGELTVQRSTDHGVSFEGPQSIVATALPSDGLRTLSLAPSSAGSWALAWTDDRDAGSSGLGTDVYARVSTDDGVSWGVEQRCDRDTAGAAESDLPGVSGVNADDFFFAFVDHRNDPGDQDLFSNRSPASSFDLSSNESRIDHDAGVRNPGTYNTTNVATDGASGVYTVMAEVKPGPLTDIFVVASSDGGYTFAPAVRVSTSSPGATFEESPLVQASSDGHVYVAYKLRETSGTKKVMFTRSTDFGATWLTSALELGTTDISDGRNGIYHPEVDMVALQDGHVFVLWSDGDSVWMARSSDHGATFITEDVDQGSNVGGLARLCAQGNRLAVVYSGALTMFGIISHDLGETWETRENLRDNLGQQPTTLPAVACASDGSVFAVWSDFRHSSWQVNGALYDGTSWGPYIEIGDPPATRSEDQAYAEVAYASTTNILVTYHNYDGGVFGVLSTDGGVSFGAPWRLDEPGLKAIATSLNPHVVSDGSGNAWFSWLDSSAGFLDVAVRHSSDAGVTFGPIYRASRDLPQGGRSDTYSAWGGRGNSAAGSGVAFMAWAGERETSYYGALVNAFDTDDFDRDTATSASDCNDSDPDVFGVPATVEGVGLLKVDDAVRLDWASQDGVAGVGTSYDIVSGFLSDLVGSGGYSAALCLVNDQPQPPYDDPRANPSAGNGDYYLVRAQNNCATASFGDGSGSPDPRDGLDSSGTCP